MTRRRVRQPEAAGHAHEQGVVTALSRYREVIEQAALAIVKQPESVFAALGIDPHQAGTDQRPPGVADSRNLIGRAGGRRRGRDRPRLLSRHDAPAPTQRASCSNSKLELAAAGGASGVIHTRDAEADTAATLVGVPPAPSVMHCFSSPDLLEDGAGAAVLRLVRRQRHVPEGGLTLR